MAATSVKIANIDRGATGAMDKFRITREADVCYIVQYATIPNTEAEVLDANDGTQAIPAYGAALPGDSTLHVMNKYARAEEGSPYVWRVMVHYSTLALVTGVNQNPLLQYPRFVGVSPIETLEGITQWFPNLIGSNQTAVPAVNSFGDPFDPAQESIRNDISIVVRRNESSFSLSRLITYNDALNQDTFWGQAPGHIRLKLRYLPIDSVGITYFQVDYDFQICTKSEGWAWKPLDQGSRGRELIGTPPSQQTVLSDPFMGINNPSVPAGVIPLDGNGYRLDPGQPVHFLGPFYQQKVAFFGADDTYLRLNTLGANSVPYP